MVYPGIPLKLRKARIVHYFKENPEAFLLEIEKFVLITTKVSAADFHKPQRLKGVVGRTLGLHDGIVYARQLFCYIVRDILDKAISFRAIGQHIYDKDGNVYDHSSVMYSIAAIQDRIDTGVLDINYLDDLIYNCKIKLYQNLIIPNDILN